MRVLLVEDSALLQQTVGTALQRSGYAVDISGDGEDGLWRAENNDYDVIVLDIMLPRLDGLALLQALPQNGKATHVLLLTARDTVQDRVGGLRAGADDYLEVATDYFAQDDAGTVYYLGEDVDEYADGKITGHEGSWLLGKDTKKPGVILPGHPKIGDTLKSEDVSKSIHEEDEVVSLSEDVIVPAGAYQNCVKVGEHQADGTTEYKYYARGVGVVREVPAAGDVRLKSHLVKTAP